MNRRTLIILIVFVSIAVFAALPAQAARRGGGEGEGPSFDRGDFLVGGDFNFRLAGGSTTIEPDQGDKQETDHFWFDLSGLAGYFVIHGLEIGPMIDIGYQTDEDDAGKTSTTDWSLGVQGGYFYHVVDRLSLFAMMGVGYVSYTQEFNPDARGAQNQSVDHSGFGLEPRLGAMYGISRRLGLTAALYYRYYFNGSGTQDNGNASADFDISSSEYGLKIGLAGFF